MAYALSQDLTAIAARLGVVDEKPGGPKTSQVGHCASSILPSAGGCGPVTFQVDSILYDTMILAHAAGNTAVLVSNLSCCQRLRTNYHRLSNPSN